MRVKYYLPDSSVCITPVCDVIVKEKSLCIFLLHCKYLHNPSRFSTPYLEVKTKNYSTASKVMKAFEAGSIVDFTSDEMIENCESINLHYAGEVKAIVKGVDKYDLLF